MTELITTVGHLIAAYPVHAVLATAALGVVIRLLIPTNHD